MLYKIRGPLQEKQIRLNLVLGRSTRTLKSWKRQESYKWEKIGSKRLKGFLSSLWPRKPDCSRKRHRSLKKYPQSSRSSYISTILWHKMSQKHRRRLILAIQRLKRALSRTLSFTWSSPKRRSLPRTCSRCTSWTKWTGRGSISL